MKTALAWIFILALLAAGVYYVSTKKPEASNPPGAFKTNLEPTHPVSGIQGPWSTDYIHSIHGIVRDY
jgi:hypothetical protein